MIFYKYLTIIFSIIMMNFAFAELRTWGMPTDTPEEKSPTEEVNPEEGTPEEAAPEEAAPEEGAPEQEEPQDSQMPSASVDSEINTDQPIQFKEEYLVKLNLAPTIFKGSNLSQFSGGMGMKLSFGTPFGFSIGDNQVKLAGAFGILNNKLEDNVNENNGWDYSDYNLTNFGLNLSTNLSALSLDLGFGMSSSDYGTYPFMSSGMSYTLPLGSILSKIPAVGENLSMSIDASAMMIFGGPDDNGDTSNFINMGLCLEYPILF